MSVVKSKFVAGFVVLISLAAWAFADPLIIAHRGNSLFYPENTIEGIDGSAGFADYVNVDIRTTLDGHLVCLRDLTVDRTTNGTGNVADMTLADLQALDAGTKFDPMFAGVKVPTFEQALAAARAKNMKLLIDVRGANATDVYNAISSANAFNDVEIQSSDTAIIEELRTLDVDSKLKLGVLGLGVGFVFNEDFLDDAKLKGASFVVLDTALVDTAGLALIKSKNLDVYVYSLNGVALQRKVEQVDVDGIITGDPKLAHDVLGRTLRTDLNDGLLTYWKMDDGLTETPTAVLDSVDLNNDGASNGIPSNNPSWVPGKFGGSVSFTSDATTVQSVQIPNSPALNPPSNELTMSMWVRFDQMTGEFESTKNWGAVFNSNSGQDYYVIYQDKSISGLRFKMSNAGSSITTSRANVLDSDLVKGEWLHIACVYDGNWSGLAGELLVYVNGKLRGHRVGQETPNLNGKGFKGNIPSGQIAAFGAKGASNANAQYFNGGIDDAAFWKRALNGSDIRYIYEQGMASRSLDDIISTADVDTWTLY